MVKKIFLVLLILFHFYSCNKKVQFNNIKSIYVKSTLPVIQQTGKVIFIKDTAVISFYKNLILYEYPVFKINKSNIENKVFSNLFVDTKKNEYTYLKNIENAKLILISKHQGDSIINNFVKHNFHLNIDSSYHKVFEFKKNNYIQYNFLNSEKKIIMDPDSLNLIFNSYYKQFDFSFSDSIDKNENSRLVDIEFVILPISYQNIMVEKRNIHLSLEENKDLLRVKKKFSLMLSKIAQ